MDLFLFLCCEEIEHTLELTCHTAIYQAHNYGHCLLIKQDGQIWQYGTQKDIEKKSSLEQIYIQQIVMIGSNQTGKLYV